jgi:LPS sulfotransferase NodH
MLEQRTPNGVFGSKMMWNYLEESVVRLRALLPDGAALDDSEVLAARLPDVRYVWLRRRDVVRQAVSWWRAGATGQYALGAGDEPKQAPPYDHAAVRSLVRYATICDRSWARWFDERTITPLEVTYEDMVDDLSGTVVRVLDFLDVDAPQPMDPSRPRMRRQADAETETIVARYLSIVGQREP